MRRRKSRRGDFLSWRDETLLILVNHFEFGAGAGAEGLAQGGL